MRIENPRILSWLKAVGIPKTEIEREEDEDTKQVTIGGRRNLWTVHYIEWVRGRQVEWAAMLGFHKPEDGLRPFDLALLSGHSLDRFDEWLRKTYPA